MVPETVRPLRRAGVESVDATDGRRLLRSPEGRAVTVSPSGKAIWDLSDGTRTIFELAAALTGDSRLTEIDAAIDVTTTVRRLRAAGLLELQCSTLPGRRPVKLVVGIEDKTYFHWQVAILLESLDGQLPEGWEPVVVVCNGHRPLSAKLERILHTYGVRGLTGSDRAARESIDFADGDKRHVGLNKIEALRVAAEHVAEGDLVFLTDSDTFLYRELDPTVFPQGDAVCKNWIVETERFFTHHGEPPGLDLDKLLEAMDATQPYQPGGVAMFLTGSTLKHPRLVADCFRFSQALYLLGTILGHSEHERWAAEMPCYSLALTAHGIAYEVVSNNSFAIGKQASIPAGTFYHYYGDYKDNLHDGGFLDSRWCKQDYHQLDLLKTNVAVLEQAGITDHERYFFRLASRAQRRLTAATARKQFVADLVSEPAVDDPA